MGAPIGDGKSCRPGSRGRPGRSGPRRYDPGPEDRGAADRGRRSGEDVPRRGTAVRGLGCGRRPGAAHAPRGARARRRLLLPRARRAGRLHRPERRGQVHDGQDPLGHPRARLGRLRGPGTRARGRTRVAHVGGSASSSASARSSGGTCRSSSRSTSCATSTVSHPSATGERPRSWSSCLELGPLLDVPVRQLSLGQRMRCDLAAALLHEPALLFLDEPTIGLDAAAKLAVRDFVRTLNRERGVTVILTTHDMDDIEALCSRVLVIHEGRIFCDGTLVGASRPREHRAPADRRPRATPTRRSRTRTRAIVRRTGTAWSFGFDPGRVRRRRPDRPRGGRTRDPRPLRGEPADRGDRGAALRRVPANPVGEAVPRHLPRAVPRAAPVPRGGAGRARHPGLLGLHPHHDLRGLLPLRGGVRTR